jgi:DNA primase large subunit
MVVEETSYTVLNVFEHPTFTVSTWANGITYIKIPADTVIEAKDIKDQYDYLSSIYNPNNKFILLIESGENSSLTKEAREFSELPETSSMSLGTAVIIKSLAERIIISFMTNVVNQQHVKLKMFEDRKNAIEWLLSLKQN